MEAPSGGNKVCSLCKKTKPVSEFHPSKRQASGFRSQCKECGSSRRVERVYEVTPEKFKQLLQEQGYACAICLNIFLKTPMVDHNHRTNRLRGLLCRRCNSALGLLEEDLGNLARAIEYLERYS